ncbi:MAG: trypsin-like serine protease, partial [Elusimicrobiaceae bacterium]|nr:trypsin-like serine protease [Elusimicrobiaceae bacterium]
MRKIVITLVLFSCGILALLAEVGTFSVVDEDKHSKKEDFYHTFEYLIVPSNSKQTGQVGKCQATRITNKWFVTAAHCVKDACKNGCEIQLDLLEYSPSALARFTHTPKKPLIFIHPDYSAYVFAKNDFALLRLDINRASITYYLRPTKKQNFRQIISAQQFNQFLEQNRRAKAALAHALHPKMPPLLYFDEGNFLLDRKISVIAIFDGVREVKQDPNPVYYLKGIGFAHTKNFGVRKGMSGSGVMSNTGELIGMVAGNFETWYKKGNGPKKEEDY